MAPRTNLRVIEPSRKPIGAGDVFTFLMPDELHRFGRVITTEARIGPMEDCVLLYFYDVTSEDEQPPLADLRPDRLLVAPVMTNRLAWSRGYFKTVLRRELETSDRLGQHCFRNSAGKYFDELSRELPGPVEPVGQWALHSFRTIDDELSTALGFELVPD